MTLKEVKKNPLLQFLISIVLYQCGTIIRIQLDNQLLGNILRIFSFFVLCYSLYYQLSFGKKPKLSFLMVFLLTWNVINIVISIITGGLNLTRMFGEDSYILNYILPFLLLYNVKYVPIKEIFRAAFIFEIFALILIILNFQYITMANNINLITGTLEENSRMQSVAQIPVMWSIPATILFLNYQMVQKKYLIISITAYVLAITFSMAFGRRSTSAYGIVFLLVAFGFYIFYSHVSLRKKILLTSLVVILIVVAIGYVANHFQYLMSRGLEDSRSAVNDAFYKDMNITDYIFGRGLNGTYYDPMNIFDNIKNQRPGHETGYLNIILHSGLLFLIPYGLLCLYSTIKGFFSSRNLLVKSMAIYIFINSLMLIIGSYPTFSLRFYILWIGILLCNNAYFRNMDNRMIKKYFGTL